MERINPELMELSMNEKYVFCLKNQDLLVKKISDKNIIPFLSDLGNDFEDSDLLLLTEKLNGKECCALAFKKSLELKDDLEYVNLRYLYGKIIDEAFPIAAKSMSLLEWKNDNQYCGRCGSLTYEKKYEIARICLKCKLDIYPRISPAIIVAIVKDDKILLAHSKKFLANWYSVLAGFIEIGETFEAAVKREVKEEVNIDIKNIKYFGNQPWPFSNSLMIAFTAEYAGGEIKADGIEIDSAEWFKVNELPEIPGKISIARQLIDWVITKEQ